MANQQPALTGNTAVFRANVPQIYLDVDRAACMLKGVNLQDVFETLQVVQGEGLHGLEFVRRSGHASDGVEWENSVHAQSTRQASVAQSLDGWRLTGSLRFPGA